MTPIDLIEFPADDLGRAQRFWEGLLGVSLQERGDAEGEGIQTHGEGPAFGLHERGRGPGIGSRCPTFAWRTWAAALERVVELGGDVVHPGERWAICRDSEASPFGLSG